MKLAISPELQLPVDAITETFGILAVKRAGKSNAAVVIAEEMFTAGLPWVAIDPKGDWWGIQSSGDGKGPGLPIVVFGGLHADVPLEPGAGQLVADIVVDQRLTCVIDVSEMTKADQRRFLTAFIKRLYQRNREPLHVFAEEADEYIPQVVRNADAEMVGVWETLVKRGGFRGLGCTLITQRSASLNNDVLTQIQTLFALRTTGVPDRDRVEKWVNYHQAGKELVQQLPTLEDGAALVFSPNFLRTVVKIRFRRRHTFDSGATPKVGVKARPPAILAHVDLARLREKMAATIEKAKADDPRELRKRISELERDLKKAISIPPRNEIREVEKVVEVPVVDRSFLTGVIEDLSKLELVIDGTQKAIDSYIRSAPAQLKRQVAQSSSVATTPALRPTPGTRSVTPRPVPPAAPNGHQMAQSIDRSIGRPQQRILDSLAWYESVGIMQANRNQLALLANYTPNTGTYNNYLGELRTSELITYPSPGYVGLTDAGRAAAIPPHIAPTSVAMHQILYAKLGGPRARILAALIAAYPNALSRETLAELTQYTVNTGTFNNYLGSLRSLQLIDYPHKGSVIALEVLFLEEEARR